MLKMIRIGHNYYRVGNFSYKLERFYEEPIYCFHEYIATLNSFFSALQDKWKHTVSFVVCNTESLMLVIFAVIMQGKVCFHSGILFP